MTKKSKQAAQEKIHLYLGDETIPELLTFLRSIKVANIVLVSDENQYKALGSGVEKALQEAGFTVNNVILYGEEISADERFVVQALLPADDTEQLYISVGSGTVTDIVRFVSYRANSHFVSLPTAPSVDGFASDGSSMTLMGYKQTIISRPPLAIFSDLNTLCNAPRKLIAAGFGDMFGKYTALADWKLAEVVNGDPYDNVIADRSRKARDKVADQIEKLEKDWRASIHTTMEALLEEGLCMLDFGNSRPASGSEHQFSHYWEMKLLREERPAVFHGSKVGLASIWIAKYYDLIRKISKDDAAERLSKTKMYDRTEEINKIKQGYGNNIAPFIIENQESHLNRTPQEYQQIQKRILDNWEELQEIAAEVPSPNKIRSMLQEVGGVTEPKEIGLTRNDLRNALDYAQYARKAFTILNICQMLDLRPSV